MISVVLSDRPLASVTLTMPTPATSVYLIGERIRFALLFKVDDTPTDPSAFTIKMRAPTGVETSYVYGTAPAVERDDVGVYHFDFTPTLAKNWTMRVVATGTLQTAVERPFVVQASVFKSP